MAQQTYSVSRDHLLRTIEVATAAGLPTRTLLTQVRDAEARLIPGTDRVPGIYAYQLWDSLTRMSNNDPWIGFALAQQSDINLKFFGLLGQLLLRCETLGQALEQMARYTHLIYQGASYRLTKESTSISLVLEYDCPPPAGAILWGIGHLCMLGNRLGFQSIWPFRVEVSAPRPPPAHMNWINSIGADLRCGAVQNRVWFSAADAGRRIPSSDAELYALLAKLAETSINEVVPGADFRVAVLTAMRPLVNATMPTLDSVSSRLGLAPRTLQRRLAEVGESFSGLLSILLRELAEEYISTGLLSPCEIAYQLGFSEVSAFARAYRRWTGLTPGQRLSEIKLGSDQNPTKGLYQLVKRAGANCSPLATVRHPAIE